MVLPFVRDLLADLEHSDAFERVRRHLGGGTGRRRVSGLTATARALYLPLFVRAAQAPALMIVADNKAAEALHAAVLSACELTGALPAEAVLRLPGHDVLPFENLSPHTEIQETRAATLWKIAHSSPREVRLVIAPLEAACMKLFPRDFYRALALRLATGEEYLPDMLVEHLLSVGYTRVDVVEMPGQVTLRGGILDVYSPEMERPVRIDFFGDEIESIRRFDPDTQRSSSTVREVLLLPLTETPVTEKLLTAINARLTRTGAPALAPDTWATPEPPKSPGAPGLAPETWATPKPPKPPGAPGLAPETWATPKPPEPPGAPGLALETWATPKPPKPPGAPGLAPETWATPKPPGAPGLAPETWATPKPPGAPGLAPETWATPKPPKPPGAPGLAPETWATKPGAPGLAPETWATKPGAPGLAPETWASTPAPTKSNATVFPGWEFFAPVAGAHHTLLDLLGPSTRVFIEEPSMVKNQGERWWNKVEQRHDRSGIGSLIRPEDIYLSPWDLDDRMRKFCGCELDQLGLVDVLDADRSDLSEVDFSTRPTQRFHGSIPAMIDALKTLMAQEARILLTAPNQGEVERLAGLLQEYHLPYRLGSRHETQGGSTVYSETSYLAGDLRTPVIVKTALAAGVQVLDLDRTSARQIVLFGAQDLTDDADVAARPAPRRSKSKTAAFISDFRDLTVGDFVVHVEHGIAQYRGLRVIDENPSKSADDVAQPPLELMILEFADEAKLYVPLTRLDLIQKYRTADTGPAPALNKLGTQAWQKTKARVKKAMQDMTGELLKLYAQRKAAQGTPFSPDTNMQREFEDAFDFNETDDQLSAIADIKQDMESTQPMDRLLCGDVGYGKTEVAMRAAFKAVQDSKQVAVLTPTTVLSFQHYESFKRRFANFPVTIEMISRFRTPKEQKGILEKVQAGKVDILIGTHRVLSKDLAFQDLGLLVVDEEQRFGVRHKERLKQMRAAIDVLSMSATPIPRTLHMSLIGMRDMSVIETPPKDRMAIQTIVARFDEKLVRTAIEMELERGGQIYFVHNRVETIYEMATMIREQVPSARVVVGHGQLPETELERVMLAFMNHEYDVLCATSIIENGLDIPLANTIVINRADRHGLSELYQLRGRVGRSNRRAYAYLLIPPEKELTEVARRRLAALKEFSDLGAGFKIAALDLELRGAGNMLGGEQSGHIEAIGFEMYTTMLEEAVRKMKGEDDKPAHAGTVLNLGISLRIDAEYIPEENQRLRMYKRLAGAQTQPEIEDVRAELHDRYGAPPEAVLNLLAAGELRLHCERLGIAQLDRKRTQVEQGSGKHLTKTFVEMLHLKFADPKAGGAPATAPGRAPAPTRTVDPGVLMRLVSRNTRRGAQFTPQGILRWPLTSAKATDVLAETRALLDSLDPPTPERP